MKYTKAELDVRRLLAADMLTSPFSSLHQKFKRQRASLVGKVAPLIRKHANLGDSVYASISSEGRLKARGMKQGIAEFKKEYPRYGKILEGLIEDERNKREVYLNFGLSEKHKLSFSEYLQVMKSIGLTSQESRRLYPIMQEITERLEIASELEERTILIGKTFS